MAKRRTFNPKLPGSCFVCKLSINACGSKLCVLSGNDVSVFSDRRADLCSLGLFKRSSNELNDIPFKLWELLNNNFWIKD